MVGNLVWDISELYANLTAYYSVYYNNWRKRFPFCLLAIQDIYNEGAAIWLTSKGDICYRLSPQGDIHNAPISKINLVFTNLLQYKIEILIEPKKSASKYILITELILVEDEIFNPYEIDEFYTDSHTNLIYRNTFQPTNYIAYNPWRYKFAYSITLQYIHYLANYKQDRFYYILNWLASFFRGSERRNYTPLVLLGTKKSGTDILFDTIIKSIFGEQYCSKITDITLESTDMYKKLTNKLFYNFDNISQTSGADTKNKRVLNSIMYDDVIGINSKKNGNEEIQNYGQILITTDKPSLPFISDDEKKYMVFKTPDNLEYIRIYTSLVLYSYNTKFAFIESIINDLENFTMILKSYNSREDHDNIPDDKALIEVSLEDKLNAFHNAIVTIDKPYFSSVNDKDTVLYNNLISDFSNHKINQQNLIKCFHILYTEEKSITARTLMKKLRGIENNIFETKYIVSGTGGVKYFPIPQK